MRNLMANLSARHFIVLSLATMLVLGGVSAAFAGRDERSQWPARKSRQEPRL